MADEDKTAEPAGVSGTETVETLTAKVEQWQALSRKNEDRAKANAAAVTERDALKTERDALKAKVGEFETEAAKTPAKIAESLRDSLVSLGVVTEDDKVLLTASDSETLLAQVKRLTARSGDKKDDNSGNRAPLAGKTADTGKGDPLLELTRGLFPKPN